VGPVNHNGIQPTAEDLTQDLDSRMVGAILAALAGREPEFSCCPSEIARALGPPGNGWRALMPQVREVLARLADQERVVVTRGSKTLASDSFAGGPIRIRRGRAFLQQK
jgi:hypothetical protein